MAPDRPMLLLAIAPCSRRETVTVTRLRPRHSNLLAYTWTECSPFALRPILDVDLGPPLSSAPPQKTSTAAGRPRQETSLFHHDRHQIQKLPEEHPPQQTLGCLRRDTHQRGSASRVCLPRSSEARCGRAAASCISYPFLQRRGWCWTPNYKAEAAEARCRNPSCKSSSLLRVETAHGAYSSRW